MFDRKVIIAKSYLRFAIHCDQYDLNPRKQIYVHPTEVHRVAGLELSEDQIVIIDQPSEELQQCLSAMTRRHKEKLK